MTDDPHLEDLRVLIADDDHDLRLLLRREFERVGITDVVEAADGTTAVEVAVATSPQLVVLDLAMPGLSGLEVLPALADVAPGATTVVVSNFPRWRLAPAARQVGAVGYVEKRVGLTRLVREILVAAALVERASHRVSGEFPADVSAPREARRFVRGVLGTPDGNLVQTVELLVSEMVANAVLHAASTSTVDVYLTGDRVRIEVHDHDPRMPRPRSPKLHETGGRGLRLIDQLAVQWGADPTGTGKVVWFEVERAAIPS